MPTLMTPQRLQGGLPTNAAGYVPGRGGVDTDVNLPGLDGVVHRRVRANGVELHLACAGAGPPLLLLHGWPQHWWCWRHVIAPLAESYQVIAPDLRGWGWSEAPPGDYAKATFAADILALLDAERLDRVKVIGHDWGGYTAFLLALEHPDRIERMVALDIPPPWSGPLRPRHLAAPLLLAYQLPLAVPALGSRVLTRGTGFVRAVVRAGSGPSMRWAEDELDAYALPLGDRARAEASSACYRTFLTRELPGTLGRRGYQPGDLTVPTLLAMGSHSPLQRVLAPQSSPNLRVELVEGAGHFIPEEAPARLLELALRFLAR